MKSRQFGKYESDGRELASGPKATVYRARAAGAVGEWDFAVKCWRFDDLTAAAEQKAAVDADCGRLIPILESGKDENDCAYYVTLPYPLSLHRFIDKGNTVDSNFLKRLCRDVIEGLEEFSSKRQRPHGNLKLGNILLDSGTRRSFHAFLADPAPEANGHSVADDLHSCGLVIYQLVRRNPNAEEISPPLERTSEWDDSLGRDADGWFAFCNRLLDKPRNLEPGALAEARGLLRRVKELVPEEAPQREEPTTVANRPSAHPRVARKKRRRRGMHLLVPVLVVVVVLVVGWFVWKRQDAEQVKPQWWLDHMSRFEEGSRGEPELHELLVRLQGRHFDRFTTKELKNELKKTLDEWSVRRELKNNAVWLKRQGWPRLQGIVEAAADFEDGSSVAGEIKTAGEVRSAFYGLNEGWLSEVLPRLTALRDTGEPSLLRVAGRANGQMAEAADFEAAAESLRQIKGGLEEVRAYYDYGWKRVDKERFRGEAEVAKAETPSPAEWLKQAKQFEPEDDKVIGERREQWIAKIQADLRSLPADRATAGWGAEVEQLTGAAERALRVDRESLAGRKSLDARLASLSAAVAAKAASSIPPPPPPPPPASEFDNLLAKLKTANRNAKTSEEMMGLAAEFMVEVRALESKGNLPTGVRSERLADFLKTQRELFFPAKPKLKISRLENARWKLVDDETDGEWATYLDERAGFKMPFRALGKDWAISAYEVPLVLARAAGWTPLAAQPGGQEPCGAQVWDGGGNPAKSWLNANLRGVERAKKSALGTLGLLEPGLRLPPTGKTPINFVGAEEAQRLASQLGAQLAPISVWEEARTLAEQNGWTRSRRLRGSAWKTQIQYLGKVADALEAAGEAPKLNFAGSNAWFPNFMSYAPGAQRLDDDKSVPGAAVDNYLWFAPVDSGGAKQVCNLIGNVAEYVIGTDGRPWVVGGSSVSKPGSELIPVLATSRNGYSDVGFRLAVQLDPRGDPRQAYQEAVDQWNPTNRLSSPPGAPLRP